MKATATHRAANEMYPSAEQIVANGKAAMDMAIAIANIQVAAIERFSALTFNAAKAAIEDNLEEAKLMLAAKNTRELQDASASIAQPSLERAIAYARSMYDVARQAQSEITKVMEARTSEMSKCILGNLDKVVRTPGSDVAAATVKSALAAAGSAYESLTKISKQAAELTEAGFAAAMHGAKERKRKSA